MSNRSRILVLSIATVLGACAPTGEKLLERAEQSLAAGEYRAAMIDLKNYVAKHPEDARARAELGLALLELGDIGGAETEIGKARSLGLEHRAAIVPECRLMEVRNEYQRILEECGDVGDAAVDTELLIVRGNALLGLERYTEARVAFEKAIGSSPDSLAGMQGLASAAFALEGAASARRVFESASGRVKEQPRYWLALGSLEMRDARFEAAERAFASAVGKTESELESRDRLSALAGLTEAQLRQGKTEEAAATSDLLLKAAPKSPLAKMLRAQAAASAGDTASARSLLEEVVSADPDNAQARTMLGALNIELGNLGQAEMHLANVVARNPDDVRAQRLLASVRARMQSPEDTLQSLKPALERPGADPALYALAGQLSLQSGNRDEALGYLAQARASGQTSPEAQLELAGAYLAAGEMDRAAEILQAMPQGSGVTEAQRETLLIATLLRQGKRDEALERARSLAARPASDTSAHGIAAAAYAAVGQRDQARAEWAKVLEARPGDAATQMNLARLDLADGNPGEAEQRLQAILANEPKNLMATLGLAAVSESKKDVAGAERWLKKAVDDHPEMPEVRLAQAQFYLAQRDFGEARAAAQEALRLSPNSAAAANALGLADLGAGNVKAAVDSFKQAVEFAPRAAYQGNLARAYLLDGKADEALRVLDAALAGAPGSPELLTLTASVALQAGRAEKAAGYVARLQDVAPEAAVTLRLEGDLAMAQKRYKDAVRHYDAAARLGSDNRLVAARYWARMGAGMPRPQAPLEEWLEANPGDTAMRVLLAEHEQRTGNDAAAIAQYEKVIEAAPSSVVALNNLAGLYQHNGDPRALSTAKRAHDLAPDNPAVQDTYGWALVESGELDRGLAMIRESARQLPAVAEIQYHLGAALARKGEPDEARRVLDQVLRTSDLPANVRSGAEAELAKLDR